ncbi:SDR family oxidoreductase [Truepera radiovictrix]|uniref:Short-chain dehydrogenase/reductase SDR n=1 Tax=Truepera radiovictrix (strain DSM 17093 / CIP 108686 / LMG 22925 / RQ-24) TaxID=649638 RepID=D7CY23_TRURR|nr:SDR family oxidoreductase [Truepera radiovictrix]ADI13383.1 short-chain dehydrogenase/reductase SDR [Truepera radiovictrix DSM 17093]WMT58054.1 SDR family oxidoreductase [Truepera radiovictrix]
MDKLLAGKVALITGGSSGIGRSIALRFAEHGASVVIADLQAEPREGGTPVHEEVQARGARAAFVRCDVTALGELEAAVDAADAFGGLDVMVNNAGIFRGKDVLEVTEDEFDTMMAINVKGVFFGSQLAAKRMIRKGGGSIINLSSVAGLQGTAQYVPYCASKGAVRLMSYALADELGPKGIRVNNIHPGLIETTMTTGDVALFGAESGEQMLQSIPLGRGGKPEDVADVALYLASDLSRYVTGASLVVDGGLSRF